MVRIVSGIMLFLSLLVLIGCQDDPIQTNFGNDGSELGYVKVDTVFNIGYKEFFVDDSVTSTFATANLVMMDKENVRTQIVMKVPFDEDEVIFQKVQVELYSEAFVGDEFTSDVIECPVYKITQKWTSNRDPRWNNYTDMIEMTDPIGVLRMTSADTTVDTLEITDFDLVSEWAGNDSINYGFLIDIPEGLSDFIKSYSSFAGTTGPLVSFEYTDSVDDTTVTRSTTEFVFNWFIIHDNSSEIYNNENFYYIKSYTPSHLLLDFPFDSLETSFGDTALNLLSAKLFIPVSRENSFINERLYDELMVFPAVDTALSTRNTTTAFGLIDIQLQTWNDDSTYVYNGTSADQEDLGREVIQQGIVDSVGNQGWLIETRAFNRYFSIYAVPKTGETPFLELKYYVRPDPRF